jgi:hypothetical protein
LAAGLKQQLEGAARKEIQDVQQNSQGNGGVDMFVGSGHLCFSAGSRPQSSGGILSALY